MLFQYIISRHSCKNVCFLQEGEEIRYGNNSKYIPARHTSRDERLDIS